MQRDFPHPKTSSVRRYTPQAYGCRVQAAVRPHAGQGVGRFRPVRSARSTSPSPGPSRHNHTSSVRPRQAHTRESCNRFRLQSTRCALPAPHRPAERSSTTLRPAARSGLSRTRPVRTDPKRARRRHHPARPTRQSEQGGSRSWCHFNVPRSDSASSAQ